MNSNQSPQIKWERFKKEIAATIREIDNQTRWQESEPKWWLEMMRVKRSLTSEDEDG